MVVNIELDIHERPKRGRKKKYATADEARKAKLEQTKASNKRKKGGAVWRGATDPIFLEHYLKLKAEAEKNGDGIFDYVKGFYDYGKKKVAQAVAPIIDPVGTIKKKVKYVKAVVFGATDLPPKVREILHEYGDKKITSIKVCRSPVSSLLRGALNAVSLGAFTKEFKKKPYDELYHLYLWIKVEGQNIILEKNAEISMDIDASVRNGSDTMEVSLPTDRTLTLNEMMANTKNYMKQKFLPYSAKDNNCQDMVMAVLKSNGLGDDAIYSFVQQDTDSLFANDNFLRKVSNTLTDVGARANTAIFGAGTETEKDDDIDWDDMDWGSFTKQMKRFQQQNKNTGIKDLEQFANMIIDNPKKYAKKTLKRANFYKNVILKKGSGKLTDRGTPRFTKKRKPKVGLGGEILSNDIVKMPNKWITFVKAYADDKGINYREAMKDPNTKALYKKGAGFWGDFAKGFTSVLDIATLPVSFVNPAAGLAIGGLSAGTKALAGQGVKKGNKRKGQPAGARLAYDDLQGTGMPTNQEAYIADLYDSINLGANAGKYRSK